MTQHLKVFNCFDMHPESFELNLLIKFLTDFDNLSVVFGDSKVEDSYFLILKT